MLFFTDRGLGVVVMLLMVAGTAWSALADPTLDAPAFEDIVIDGDADDWSDDGFRVDVLYPRGGRMLPADDFQPTARWGWDKEGLLVMVRVMDDAAVESPGKAPWAHDSVELFVAGGPTFEQQAQVIISPGMDQGASDGAELATQVFDRRTDKTVPFEPEVAARAIEGGYVVEARLPWTAIGIEPAAGETLGVNLQVNDRDQRNGGQRYETTWFTTGWSGQGPQYMHRLRLAEQPSEPSRIVVGSRPGPAFSGQRVFAFATPDHAGETVSVSLDGQTIATEPLHPSDGFAEARINIPAPSSAADASGEYTVSVDDQPLHTFAMADNAPKIRQAVSEARLHVHPVFTGSTFPRIEFETPGWIKALLGDYTAETTYYDADYNVVTEATEPGRYGAITTIQAEGIEPVHLYTTLYRAPSDREIDWDQLAVSDVSLPDGLGLDPAVIDAQNRGVQRFVREELSGRFSHEPAGPVLLAGLYETPTDAEPIHSGTDPWSRDQAWWLALKKNLGHFKHRYHADLPEGYDDPANADKKWPMILFLHGAGARGNDDPYVTDRGPTRVKREGMDMPFIVISPQCEPNQWWAAPRVGDLLDELVEKYNVDEDRIYLTGLSMGGHGSWYAAQAYPDRFAAVAPICGGGEPMDAGRLTDVPIWTFHGDADAVVTIDRSQAMVDAIKEAGGENIAFTVYPGVGHDAWTATYNNPALYEWFLANKRGEPIVMPTPEAVAPPAP